MTIYTNTGAGGTSGTTVTTGNSGAGSGTAFNSTTIGTGSTLTYTNSPTPLHGTLWYSFVTAASQYTLVSLPVGSSNITAGRMYFETSVAFTTATVIASALNSSNTTCFGIQLNASNKLLLVNTANTIIFTGSTALTASTIYRAEWTVNATSGAWTIALYSGDSTTSLQSGSGTSTFTNTPIANYRFGKASNGAQTGTIYIGDMAVSDNFTNFIGPLNTGMLPFMGS